MLIHAATETSRTPPRLWGCIVRSDYWCLDARPTSEEDLNQESTKGVWCTLTKRCHLNTQGHQQFSWAAISSAPARRGISTPAAHGQHVFITHSTKDAGVVRDVCIALETAGLRCWFAPRDIVPGMTWASAIIEGLDRSRAVVLVLSRSANLSNEVLREVERASRTGKPIVTLRIEDVEPSGGLAYFLSATQWLDALHRPLRPVLEQLAAGLRRLLDVEPPAKAPSEAPREIAEVDLDHLGRSASRKSGLLEWLFRDR